MTYSEGLNVDLEVTEKRKSVCPINFGDLNDKMTGLKQT
jgi:hypothetical protein